MLKFHKATALLFTLLIIGAGLAINSCTHAPYVLPENMRTGDPTICFETDILPIFVSNCAKSGCHDAGAHKGGYQLDSYTNVMKKGIIPGNIAASVIWESIAIKTFNVEFMPRGASALNSTQLDKIKRWIQTGAIDSGACNATCDSNNFTYSGGIAPLVQTYCTGCHSSSSAAGGSLMDYASVQNAAVNGRMLGDIQHQSGYNAMPPGITLSDCQVAQVRKWVAAGAPNN